MKVLAPEERCQEKVAPEGQWGSFQQYQCNKKAVVTRDGKRYCKIHDPEYIKEKDAKREAAKKKFNCPKCNSHPMYRWFKYCPICGTEYPKVT